MCNFLFSLKIVMPRDDAVEGAHVAAVLEGLVVGGARESKAGVGAGTAR